MPNFSTIIGAISTVGFPIVLTIVLVCFCYKVYNDSKMREDSLNKQIKDITAANQESNKKFSESMDSFGRTLSCIDNRISILETALISKH